MSEQLSISDANKWEFINGAWTEEDNILKPPADSRGDDGRGMQGVRFAFYKEKAYRDVHVRSKIRHTGAHQDAGLILRARDAGHFYLLHFPDCGQQSRAQHFWAVLSKMDDSGYLRNVKMAMVNRVASHPQDIHNIEASFVNDQLNVRIDGKGIFQVSDTTYLGPGCVGLMAFGNTSLADVRIEGKTENNPWRDGVRQRKNWFYPCTEKGWASPQELIRASNGELMLYFSVQGKPLIIRSSDNGRTWSEPEAVEHSGRLWQRPDGTLVMVLMNENEFTFRETKDDGRTWSESVPMKVGPVPRGMKGLHLGPQAFVNLRDGSARSNGRLRLTALMLLYGAHESTSEDFPIYTWGAHHCQAYSCRSTDNGLTWTDPVNIDNRGIDQNGEQIEGSMDLTEVCATQTGGGRILALIRPIYSPWMWETWSDDGGVTWGPCIRGAFPGYATPNMLKTTSGAILVAHRMPSLTIHCSLDDGVTFDQGTMIDSGLWCMGSMIEVEPDPVLYAYMDSFESLMRAQFIRVTATGLEPVD